MTFGGFPSIMKDLNLGESLFVDSSSKDFKILVQGEEILAHKFILALKSPVLAALLQSDMMEARSGVMKIEDFDAQVVRVAIDYFYRGFLPIINGDAKSLIGLVHFGHKYDIPDLIDYTIKKVWYHQKSFEQEDRKELLSIVSKIDPEIKGVCEAVLGIFMTEGFHFDPIKYPNFSYNLKLGADLYADKSFKNLKIRYGTREIFVHKSILSIYCPTLLQTMTRRPNGKFGYFKPETVEEVIGFLYKGDVSAEAQKDPTILMDLLNFGREYKCKEIMKYSFELLKEVKKSMSEESKGDLIKLISKMGSSAKVYDFVIWIFSPDFKDPKSNRMPNAPGI